ncbi:methyltransferase [Methanospirillum stamsii]|uniref:Methyltransferase n=2 Tax=Methanospirillum stamsii TaxID=1277351 RepID=A0A2V2NDW0_9EURY|nr:methyltransferase [Methanospirillum stamsii]
MLNLKYLGKQQAQKDFIRLSQKRKMSDANPIKPSNRKNLPGVKPMKNIPEVKNDFGKLYEKLLTNQEKNLFIAAIELGIFQELSNWKSTEELVKKLNINQKNAEVFLNSLVSLDLIEKKNGSFKNLPAVEEFFAEKNDKYLGDSFLSYYDYYNMSSTQICELVRNGPGDGEMPNINSEDLWTEHARLTVNFLRAGMAQLAIRHVSSLPEYPTFRRMLDLGCGTGVFGTLITMNHPSMKAVLFDRPAVLRVAQEVIDEYEMGDRVQVTGGDYICDPIGENYDLVWASETLNFAGEHLDTVIKKIFNALNPGGVYVSLSDGMTDERTKPKEMIMGTLMTALYGNDVGMSEGVIANAMIKSGFASVQSRTVKTPIGEMVMDIARKSS